MSLGGRLTNIFVAPAEVFDEVKAVPPNIGNWVAPLVATIIVGIIFSMVAFSQPTIMQEMRVPAEKRVQQMVDSGKITQQIADQQLAMFEKIFTPEVFKVVGILINIIGEPAWLFLVALIIWLIGTRLFGGSFEYMKAVETVGLSGVIMVPGKVIYMLVAVIYGSLYMTPGPALLISHYDMTNKIHLALSAFDVFWLWYVAVLSVGLSRLSGASFLKSALCGYGFWAMYKLVPALVFGGK